MMKKRSCIWPVYTLTLLLAGFLVNPLNILAQEDKAYRERKAMMEHSVFPGAAIRWNPHTRMPEDIQADPSFPMNEEEFLLNLGQALDLSPDLVFEKVQESGDAPGERHIRYRQHYRGLELARTQFLVHLKDGRVVHAHGRLAEVPGVNLVPALDREEAFLRACSHLGLEATEARKNRALMSRMALGHHEDGEDGKLMLSGSLWDDPGMPCRLVYRFDITTRNPLRRFDVEVDAHTGELVGKFPTLYHENIPTTGNSLYNGEVDIVVSDTISKEAWPDNEAYWHPDQWNAYGGSGTSWWMADTAGYSPGGYDNDWFVVLETDPVMLNGEALQLTFHHRYSLEDPDGAYDYNPDYDGWDGINVRISVDGGNTWKVLSDPLPAYTCTSLWSFGGIHNEGPGIPGWAGRNLNWSQVHFDLSAYRDQEVRIRFDFASDGGWASMDDNSLFGWQLDNIEVRNNSDLLYSNAGSDDNIRPYSISNWVGNIEGKYRLRETTRGSGIATINAESGLGFITYVDYVQETFPFTSAVNRVGVGIHWAAERTYDYFSETFGRNSFDNEGGAIISYADWGENDDVNTAFWTGSFAAYGAGDGLLRSSYGALDVVGHEITHGVTDYSSNLVYWRESGALNESFSDIFGAAVEFYAEGRDSGDWLLGEDIFNGPGAIRSMQDPKSLSSPDTYLGEHWVDTKMSFDNGGVHFNSGVQNHWFYLLSEGGSGVNDDGHSFQVTGIGLDDAAHIAYRNLTHYLLPTSEYMDAAAYSIHAAEDLFGPEAGQVQAVQAAWEAVGIYMDPRLIAGDTLLEFFSHVDNSQQRPLVLRNKGIETLEINEFRFSDPLHFTLQPPQTLPLQLEGGDSLKLWVEFSPGQEILYSDTLTLVSSDPLFPERIIRLSGLGTAVSTLRPGVDPEVPGYGLSVRPNPFRDRLQVSYTLPMPDRVTIEIRDITGKLLYADIREASEGETMEILWSTPGGESSYPGDGIFLLSLRTGGQVLVKKIIKSGI